ncbi:RtcB family protein [Escherichia coli]
MQRVVGMPDLHPGRGYPIGAAFFSVGRFYPALVGNDIGCAMAHRQSGFQAHRYKVDKVEKRFSGRDEGKVAGGKAADRLSTVSAPPVARLDWLRQ